MLVAWAKEVKTKKSLISSWFLFLTFLHYFTYYDYYDAKLKNSFNV